MAKGRKRKNKNYFAEKEEEAVVNYINSDSAEEKDFIYNTYLKEPFRKMVESILRKYPIHIGDYDIEEVEANALSHLIEKMVTFDKNRMSKSGQPSKAFSYCQTIVRNYYKDHSRRSYIEKKRDLSFDNYIAEVEENTDYMYVIDEDELTDLERLIEIIINSMEQKIFEDKSLKKNEVEVGRAIINVLSNWHTLFMEETPEGKVNKKVTNKYQKNKILFLIKEITGLTTKEIRVSMKQFKELYFMEKQAFFDDNNE